MGRTEAPRLVLASESRMRRRMFEAAGLVATAEAAHIDEAEVKTSLLADGAGFEDIPEVLAEMKARKVSERHPGALVIGGDQVLVCEGRLYDKPASREEARAHLRELRGRQHALVACAVAVRDGVRLWHHTGTARLTMRLFGDGFIDHYLDAVGPRALESVGAYQIEGPGAQLFQKMEGDPYTIWGLPLLALLEFLREHGVVER